jgi:hypothetical protein
MTDVEVQVEVYKTTGTVLVLFEATELDRLKSMGLRLEDLIVHRNVKDSDDPYKPLEVRRWQVRGRKRNVCVAHLLLDCVGKNRHVQYDSTDGRVASPHLDMRTEFLRLPPPMSEAEKARRKRVKEKAAHQVEAPETEGVRFTVECCFRLFDRGELVGVYDSEQAWKAAAYDQGDL